MNKRISTELHCFISVVSSAGSEKTRLIVRIIVNRKKLFSPSFDKINLFQKLYHQLYGSIVMGCDSTHVDIELVQGKERNTLKKLKR